MKMKKISRITNLTNFTSNKSSLPLQFQSQYISGFLTLELV